MPRLSELYKGEYGTDFYLRVAKGEISGFQVQRIQGLNNSISTGGLIDISQIPSIISIPNTNGIQCNIVSSSANDTTAGTGVRTLELVYLDTNFNVQEEIITLNGVTPVNTVATNINRIWWMHAKTTGSLGVAAGNISLQNAAGTVTYEYIVAGENQSLSSRFCIPNGTTGYILNWAISSYGQTQRTRLRATVDKHDRSLMSNCFVFQDVAALSNSVQVIEFKTPLRCPAQSEIKISSTASVSGGTVMGSFEILLIDN